MYLNKAFLYGNLTRDPEIKALPGGTQVASFGIATNRTFKDKNGTRQDQTEYHNIVAFGKTAETIGQYMKKGKPIFVEGRIQTRSWDDKGTGEKKYRTEIVVDNFQFGPQAPGTGGSAGYSAPSTSNTSASKPKEEVPSMDTINYPEEDINPEDIPF
ncbi:MAG: single-stranded DNA-binding protein [bacterium]